MRGVSDHDLRRILDARDRELEAKRRRQGKHGGTILLALIAIVAVWFWIVVQRNDGMVMPPTPKETAAAPELPAILQPSDSAKAGQMPGVFAEDPAKAKKPGSLPDLNVDQQDVKFATELMNFLQPPAASKPAEPEKH
ncbi:hypothetical protein [Luteolibacter sp. LG18]|uniref:hypothetical protein n=1 Tax=Luteolibacter sp. LG18 TaxID=2819286 RepID=UPI002B2F64F1|nr:hypothetical protein llg_39420 [Luteolibacter sp. LG18]